MPGSRSAGRAAAIALAVAALAAAGCGGDITSDGGDGARGPRSGGDMLAAADIERVVRARREIAACRSGADRRGVQSAAETLVDVYRDGPEQIFEFGSGHQPGRPMLEVLEESATGLRRCGDRDALATVEQALQEDG